MSSEIINVTTPVARLVEGSLYNPSTKDAMGNPLITRNGPDAGKPRVNFYFAVAIKKSLEGHWNQTDWGQLIWNVAHTAFKNGETQRPNFAWKVIDGDSQIPNQNGIKPYDKEGFADHWVLKFSSSFAPQVYNWETKQTILEKDYVNLGDYVQVGGTLSANTKAGVQQPNPGVFLNHKIVAFRGYGPRIQKSMSAEDFNFGEGSLPANGSPIPLTAPMPQVSTPSNLPITPVTPYTQILTPPVVSTIPIVPEVPPVNLTPMMTPKAAGGTYEQFKARGWTDELLKQHGYIV